MNQILPNSFKRVLITGGAGFIGGAVIRRLLVDSDAILFNLDKMGYASDLSSIEKTVNSLGANASKRHNLLKVDLSNACLTAEAVKHADPDIVLHLAAETHVDRSIDNPRAFVSSNIVGTFNLLQSLVDHWEGLSCNRKERFRMLHISTDEVFGSLGESGSFNEKTQYDPKSPYSASKASSDHFVKAWHNTYKLPVVITNCSNNYGPWQFPEKLIPVVILNALLNEDIPLYGDGGNLRDWLYVEDHVDALLKVAVCGDVGESYCIGGDSEKNNKEVVLSLCKLLDITKPENSPHSRLIKSVADRPGHDRRYSIDSTKIRSKLNWKPKIDFENGIETTFKWYLNNIKWCSDILKTSGYSRERLGLIDKYN